MTQQKIIFTLDNKEINVEREITDSVLDILREDCQKKEIKQGCSPQGACGSCMVLVKGKPRLSCTLRAKNIENKKLQTTASIAPKLKHRLEQLFVAHGATGCGYCMPAILHQIATLLHHVPRPTESLINKALHMHACPCLGFSAIKEAISTFVDEKELPEGNLHPRGRLALWGKRSRVADISTPNMLWAIPVFADRGIGKLEKLHIPESPENFFVFSTKNSSAPFFQQLGENFQRVDTLLALVLSEDKLSAKRFSTEIKAEYSEITPMDIGVVQSKKCRINDWETLPSNIRWVEIQDEIQAQDAGYLETEACFVQENQIIVNGIPLGSLKGRYPNHQIESWAGGGSFGGRTQDDWVDWAVHASTRLKRPVLLSLSMEDSIRIRPKSPAFEFSLALGYQKNGTIIGLKGSIDIDGGSRPQLSKALLDTISENIENLYQIPFLDLKINLVSKTTTINHPLLDQGLRAVSTALERLVGKMRQDLQMDPFSIRERNLRFPEHKEILETLRAPYLRNLKTLPEEHHIELACSSFAPTQNQIGQIQILIAEKDLILIQGGTPDTGDFLEYQLIETLHRNTGIPLENIGYEVSSDYIGENTAQFLLQKALEYACAALLERLQDNSLSSLIGEIFEGEAIYHPQDQQPCFSVSFALLSPKNIPLQVHTATQGASFQNQRLSQAYLQGIQYRSLAQEELQYQANLLPNLLFRQLNLPKAKESPLFDLQFQSNIIIGIGTSVSASVFACVHNAKRLAKQGLTS